MIDQLNLDYSVHNNQTKIYLDNLKIFSVNIIPSRVHIKHLYIPPENRDKGVARKLIEYYITKSIQENKDFSVKVGGGSDMASFFTRIGIPKKYIYVINSKRQNTESCIVSKKDPTISNNNNNIIYVNENMISPVNPNVFDVDSFSSSQALGKILP